MKTRQACIETPLGTARIKGDEDGIQSISILGSEVGVSDDIPVCLQIAAEQLREYFAGERTAFQLPLNPRGTAFQKRVWEALLTIPYGKTISYMELTQNIGDEKAIRAVAAANGQNPLWVVVPCHRVIGSDGSLTGYAGGLWRKKWLLEHESPYHQGVLF